MQKLFADMLNAQLPFSKKIHTILKLIKTMSKNDYTKNH